MDIFSLIALSKAKNAESKSIGVYHYKGSVETASALPSQGNVQGDVWNIVNTSAYGPAGTNVAWAGGSWDPLGGMAPVTSVNGRTGAVIINDYISYIPQSLNDGQKLTARENIGADWLEAIYFTTDLVSWTCTKTYSEIATALANRKEIRAYVAFNSMTIAVSLNVIYDNNNNLVWSLNNGSQAIGALIHSSSDTITYSTTTIPLTAADIGAQTPFLTVTLTIATTDWANGSCTKTVTGMTADALVFVKYSDTDGEYTETQGANSMIFTAATTPSEAVTVDVAWFREAVNS